MDKHTNQGGQLPSELWQSNKQLMTVPEIAKLLNVPKSWVYQQTMRGQESLIPFIKMGKYLRFDSEMVLAVLKLKSMEYCGTSQGSLNIGPNSEMISPKQRG